MAHEYTPGAAALFVRAIGRAEARAREERLTDYRMAALADDETYRDHLRSLSAMK